MLHPTLLLSAVLCVLAVTAAPPPKLNPHVLGGTDAKIGDVPMFAALYRTEYGTLSCGGSILSKNIILTAAHCVVKPPSTRLAGPKQYVVRNPSELKYSVGNLQTNKPNLRTVTKIIVHDQFNLTGELKNDIALLQVEDVPLSDTIKTIKIYMGSLSEGDLLSAAGMGITDPKNDAPNTELDIVTLPIESKATCNAVVPDYQDSNGSQVCAGGVAGKDTCSGDSGGPLYKIFGKDHAQVGLTSFGGGPKEDSPICGAAKGVGIYTHVASYIDWIATHSGISADILKYTPTKSTGAMPSASSSVSATLASVPTPLPVPAKSVSASAPLSTLEQNPAAVNKAVPVAMTSTGAAPAAAGTSGSAALSALQGLTVV
ncbi:Testisin [Tieghemiomyces parasiticus]|uniref:Testisin n=1 Tax=Tieghemiomyces parasiticus TaxID=78921 RepID=A0A9W8AFU0_9FUNG|nr:Testisin [Tieghemiomyces parasiticus]